MLFEVSFLTEALATISALIIFDAGVKSDVVFDVTRFVEGLATTTN